MTGPSVAAAGPVQASAACRHPFLDRLARAQRGSAVIRTFLTEFSVLRRSTRVLDAAAPGSDDRYRSLLRSVGIVGPGWVESALPTTRATAEALQRLTRDPLRREAAWWAIERVGRTWAGRWAEAHAAWDTSDYTAAIGAADPMVPDPLTEVAVEEAWQTTRDTACEHLAAFLDALEDAVTDVRRA